MDWQSFLPTAWFSLVPAEEQTKKAEDQEVVLTQVGETYVLEKPSGEGCRGRQGDR